MSDKFLFTVAIPTYNRAKLLERTMQSVISQMTDEVELLISDNASDDGTAEMVAEKQSICPINYIRNAENIGPDANFLQCLERANGKYVLLLGSDDILVEGALNKIVTFLKQYPQCDFIFMNHTFFEGDYIDSAHCKNSMFKASEDIVTQDKRVLMDYAKTRITFMSSIILSKEAFKRVADPTAYVGTYFVHTCIAIEALALKDANIGIISSVCVAQDMTYGNAGLDRDSARIFLVFGKGMEYTYCQLAPKMNFDGVQMRKIYTKWISISWPRAILRMKMNKTPGWKQAFKEYGKPILKKYKKAYVKVMPYLLVPGWFAAFMYKRIRPIYKKIKRKSQVM